MSSISSTPRWEYPRPQFVREEWLNLNGPWSFLIDDANVGLDEGFTAAPEAGKTNTFISMWARENRWNERVVAFDKYVKDQIDRVQAEDAETKAKAVAAKKEGFTEKFAKAAKLVLSKEPCPSFLETSTPSLQDPLPPYGLILNTTPEVGAWRNALIAGGRTLAAIQGGVPAEIQRVFPLAACSRCTSTKSRSAQKRRQAVASGRARTRSPSHGSGYHRAT